MSSSWARPPASASSAIRRCCSAQGTGCGSRSAVLARSRTTWCSSMSTTEHVEVLVVGGGPTGLAIANALGGAGVTVLLVEQDPGVATLPRAVSIDDEGMRFVQSIGLEAETQAIAIPGTGTKYFGARGQLLAYARGPDRPRY